MKRKSLSLRQALILLGIAVLVGYPAGRAAGGCIWGGTCSNPNLVLAGVFTALGSFIGGMIALLRVVIKSVIAKVE
jgi:hypothetical protein